MGGIRVGQLNIDEDVDCKGHFLLNVAGIRFSDPGPGEPPPTLGEDDSDVALVIAALESADTRTRTFTFDGSKRLTGITEKDGADTVKAKSYTLDSIGRVGQRQVVIGGKTIIDTFVYVGLTPEIQSQSRSVT